ncbi:MAG TPA: thioredoxin [Vicinamibacteria bacterium]|nr:thioredoxin [Vicinamibacteria bacterium]
MSDKVFAFTDHNFEAEVLRSKEPVLVDFWAAWCAPCRMIAPFIEAAAAEFQGRAKVGKLDVDQNPQTADRYGITGIPSLLLFKDGQVVEQRVGALPKAEIVRLLEAHAPALA